ncbi:hypothetical protein F2Y18_15805 [Bacillus cereus]|uniref:DNA methyltransferase n=1 Tax=Bacillus cereus TaxID=1396 RepID=UPI00122EE99B|nr:DNA methyltransferase [Bacillus cereus]KAA2396108.1 hypothetical protein F2Y18_15805 [Bacillus cereus]
MSSSKQIKAMFFNDSNKLQTYATHSLFRYFGKLPPTLVRKILDENSIDEKSRVLELMCGSGTTLVECNLRGTNAVGVDVNPLSVLVSKVKNTYIPIEELLQAKLKIEAEINLIGDAQKDYFRPSTRNLDYWFTERIQNDLSSLKYIIDNTESFINNEFNKDIKDLFLVTFASIIRKMSNASPKTGRIFRMAEDNIGDVYENFSKKLQTNIHAIQDLPERNNIKVLQSDARNTSLDSETFDFILNHPPYFALYKYSSDVMRFELEWLNFNRRQIAKNEIEDGFKTTKEELLDVYIEDMKSVFQEARRLLKEKGKLCVVVSDSTLREKQLPVVSRLIKVAQEVGLELDDHYLREVAFTQASYHKSANPNIKTNEDHLMYFSAK